MMAIIAWGLVGLPVILAAYAYIGYPWLLRLLGRIGPAFPGREPLRDWPMISICVPAYNEEAQIRGLIESLLKLDYPVDRCQILIVSDASSDGTDEIVKEYADRGIELLRMPRRSGKTAAENAAIPHLRGEIIVNTDASIRIAPEGLRPLIARFANPTIGVASGRDISVAGIKGDANTGESGYVGYEMRVRGLETAVYGIVGASGCYYAIRAELHRLPIPDSLSRDFAAALTAREHGYRAVSVDEAICYVPRTVSLAREYRRKVRTITRGMETLASKWRLLNPVRYGLFSWMLFSHKICRWAVPWAAVPMAAALVVLAPTSALARVLLGIGAALVLLGAAGWVSSSRGKLPALLALPAFVLAGNTAVLHAGIRAMLGDRNAVWEPTRREVVVAP